MLKKVFSSVITKFSIMFGTIWIIWIYFSNSNLMRSKDRLCISNEYLVSAFRCAGMVQYTDFMNLVI